MKTKDEMLIAICDELKLRAKELKPKEAINTIYFGGGTPTVLAPNELESIINTVYTHYRVTNDAEITIEANPDDLTKEVIEALANSKINRISVGIQSFFDEDLTLMNRAHNAKEAEECLLMICKHFKNISIDLIYGIPNMTLSRWKQNVTKALSYNIPHLSCYALTVEPNTALPKLIAQGKIPNVEDQEAEAHFEYLLKAAAANGFDHYELSNFGKAGFYSKNNTAYWQGKSYIGIGPSAHSFDGKSRSWNINNNKKYIQSIAKKELPREIEVLSLNDQYNEYVMTGLRTIWGVSLQKIEDDFGIKFKEHLLTNAATHLANELLKIDKNILYITNKGKFLCDGIASDLFLVNL